MLPAKTTKQQLNTNKTTLCTRGTATLKSRTENAAQNSTVALCTAEQLTRHVSERLHGMLEKLPHPQWVAQIFACSPRKNVFPRGMGTATRRLVSAKLLKLQHDQNFASLL